jgi:hypothetical protein
MGIISVAVRNVLENSDSVVDPFEHAGVEWEAIREEPGSWSLRFRAKATRAGIRLRLAQLYQSVGARSAAPTYS